MSSQVSRRSFVTGAVAGATLAASAAPAFAATSVAPEAVTWDEEYDVVVVGYGAAGANAAINAADNGAKVLLIEKCAEGHEGGNSKYSGQGLQCFEDKEEALKYYKSLRGLFSTPSDAVIQAYADHIEDMRDYLIFLGAEPENLDNYKGSGEPWRSKGEYPELDGAGHMLYYCVSGSSFDGAYYSLLQDNVAERSDLIDVWFSAPGKHLVQDPQTQDILGVEVEVDGASKFVRAGAVVLATGGFENNQQMVQDYLQEPYVIPYGSLENTGDGIVMAVETGAELWHMGNAAGFLWCYKLPDADRGMPIRTASMGIYVGPSGERFTCETQPTRHGRIPFAGRYEQNPSPLPCYFILDSASLASGKILSVFSEGNVDEVEKGLFTVADTIEELADKLADQLPVEVRRPNAPTTFQENFIATVQKWNEFCEAGEDARFLRPEDTLTPIAEGPFYALELGIQMYNTQGGPVRDETGHIVDRDGNPIPHLYSAGELGAIWSDAYNGGGNLGECTAFGRISGANAAADALSQA